MLMYIRIFRRTCACALVKDSNIMLSPFPFHALPYRKESLGIHLLHVDEEKSLFKKEVGKEYYPKEEKRKQSVRLSI